MAITRKKKELAQRASCEPPRKVKPEAIGQAEEDARDLRDALRARDEAKRKGVYPWEWLKQEIEP
jgi:hypothetical protein